jgi:hypothetical protein
VQGRVRGRSRLAESIAPEVHKAEKLVFKKVTTNYEASRYLHTPSGEVKTASFPDFAKAKFQFGAVVQAAVVFSRVRMLLPVGKIVEQFTFFNGLSMSEASVINIVANASRSKVLTDFREGSVRHLVHSRVAHFDCASTNINGKNRWAHISVTDQCTLISVSPKRGHDGMNKAKVLHNFTVIAAVDRRITYFCQ